MDFFEKNMRLLKKKSKSAHNSIKNYHQSERVIVNDRIDNDDIVAQIEDMDNDLTINIEQARKNGYTMNVISNNKSIYFHSKYAPIREANKLVDNLDLTYKSKAQIFSLGFGLGHHIVELFSKDRFDKVFVIEPYLSIFYAALLFNDLSPLLKNKKFILMIGNKNNLYSIIRSKYQVSLAKEVKFFEHTPSIRLFNEDYEEIYQEVKNAIEYKNISQMTNIKVAKQWRNNIIKNLPFILKNPKADDFFESFSDIPIICVAAGPSLDKNIRHLKKAKGKALIICVGTALKALLNEGIKPDIVVTMDGSDLVYQQFEGIEGVEDVFLFSEKANCPAVNKNWSGKQVFFTMKRNLSGWVESMKGKYTAINTGGSVAHSMVDLAYKLGGNPIILVGQDLAYSNQRTHASGTMYDDNRVGKEKMYSVEGINGEKVYTSKGLKSFLNYFNDYFSKRPDRLYIDATEGGAKIENTEIINLEQTINNYCSDKINPLQELQRIYKNKINNLTFVLEDYKLEVENTVEKLKEAINILDEHLELIKQIELEIANANQVTNTRIQEIERETKASENRLQSYSRINYFTQRTLLIEELKYQEVNNKYFLNNKQEINEKIKYYRTYWVNCWKQLKISCKLLSQVNQKLRNE